MKQLIRRAIALVIAGGAIVGAVSGCVVVPERQGYHEGYHEGYYDHGDHRYWER
jgi:hypothetical protein